MAASADFLDLLKERGHFKPAAAAGNNTIEDTEGTTILAVRYAGGVLVAGDRRATMGNVVVHDRADKVLCIDDDSVLALSGSPAVAYEIARMLEISFQYYRRSQLQALSLEGKLRTVSRLLRDNLPLAMQGIGAVVPIFSLFDVHVREGRIYFYDLLGAQFESVDFCTAGSGSPGIRGALYYLNRWGDRSLSRMEEAESLTLVLKMLETAAEYDTATGGYKPGAMPQVVNITADGIAPIDVDRIERVYADGVEEGN